MSLKVEFRKSGITVEWDSKYESLLELAQASGVDIDSQCEQGFCGTCKTKLISGEVDMETTDGLEPEDEEGGMILPCVAVPTIDVALDA
ncbi:MAG: 2Fe-2S iron-sulfur cluster binding domain-containing protein [Deltaproteobacteria bacterium]|nr:2Fe-2S iron-sulfur cluster binding domain-containing protein [Deltaproteobacteria bacterium]